MISERSEYTHMGALHGKGLPKDCVGKLPFASMVGVNSITPGSFAPTNVLLTNSEHKGRRTISKDKDPSERKSKQD